VKFTLNKKTYSYKHLLSEITLKEYIDYLTIPIPKSVVEEKKSEDLTTDELLERAEYALKQVHFWTKVPIDILTKTEAADVYGMLNSILAVFAQDIPLIDRFEIKGEEYLFPKELLQGSTFGEFADATLVEKLSGQLNDGNYKAVPGLMAIYCRKKGEAYVGELIKEREKLFLTVTLDKVFAFVSFFLQLKIISIQRSTISLMESHLPQNRKRLALLN